MNTEDETDRTPVQRLLENQRPPAASEPLPAMPDDLRRQWSAHFGVPRRAAKSHLWAWVSGLAAAAAIVVGAVWFTHVPPEPSPSSDDGTTEELLTLSSDLWEADEMQPMSAESLALLRYEVPSTAGLYVRP